VDLQYRMLDDAEEHLDQAEQLYLKLSTTSDFSLNLIEINRLRALLKMHRGRNDLA
jgi:adenine C2-methylase RlmN of 23S rRNA A2503 and tRNA A37